MITKAITDAAKGTFNYSGRSERLEHWSFILFTAVCGGVAYLLDKATGAITVFPLNWVVLIFGVWLILANVALMVRRLHDHNFSGFMMLLPLLCSATWIVGYDQFTNKGNPALTPEQASQLMEFGKWSMIGSAAVLLSFFSRGGDLDENKYGFPT